jgi:hypothetical protein
MLHCGSAVLATLTGQTVDRVEAMLMDHGVDPESTRAIDLRDVFAKLGYTMTCVRIVDQPYSGPPLGVFAAWQGQRRRRPLIVAVEEPGETDHWVTVWGPSICDSLSGGRWTPLMGSPLWFKSIAHAWTIDPPPRWAGPVKMG